MKPYRIMMFIVLLALLWQPTKSDAQSGCDVADVAWHPTEDLIAFNCHEIINIYTVQFALVKALIPPPEPANTLPVAIALEWSPNGSYFAAIISRFDAPGGDGQDSRLVVWDTNTWAIILDIPDRGAPIAWSPDSSIVATDSLFALDAVYFYAIPTGIELGRCDDCSGALDIAWNPTDLHQFIASFSSMTFFVDPVALGTPPTIVEGISLVGDGYSPDGARIVFYNRDAGRIEVQDAYTRQVLATLSFDLTGPINSYHWLSDGIYIDNGNSVTVRWDGLSQQTDILPEGHYWNPDGSVYFSSNRTGAFIHDTLTGEIKAQFVLDATSQVSSFSLFDVNTGETISDYTPLTNGTTINAEQIGATNLGFRVITNPSTVGSVIFDLNGATAVQIDNTAPYDFTNWTPTAGTYSLIATPYSEADGAGTAGLPMTVTFTLISSSASCDTTIAAGDTSGLISAIVTANGNGAPDTICLTQSTYTVTAVNNTTDGPNGLPSTATDITIVGNGATIMRDPAAAAFRIFHVAAGGSLTLDGVTISGGSAMSAAPGNDGGAIYNRGTVNLTGNTSITNSTANADGGAVYNRGTFTVGVGSTISSNTAADDGGGVYTSSGTLNVTGGTITDNTAADEGGGIRSVDSTITLIGANITDNTATGGSGGGLYTTSTTLTVTNGVFSGNGGNSGGGLYFTNSPSAASLDGVQILNNTGTNGGGLYLTSSGQAALTSVTVSGNQATSSAAGIWSGGTLTLTGSTISNNGNTSQPGSAGGIRAAGATLTVNDTVISGNLVNSISGSGAGVYIASAGTILINGGEISGNDARNGGGLYNSGSLSLSSIIDDNAAQHYGGGLYITGGTTHVDGSVFSNNTAIDRGGAVYNGVTTISWIHDSCITGNTSADSGGVYSNTAAFDAIDNWWGAANGPSGAGAGTGDAANSNVTFSPFLTTGCPPGTGEGGAQQLMGPQVQMHGNTPTPVDPVRVPFNATFEDEVDWYAGGTWVLDTLNGHTNAPSWMVNTSSRGEESILEMRAPVDLRGPRSPRLTFWERGQIASSDVVMVEALPEGANTWSVIDIRSTVPNVWTQRSVSLSAYRGQRIRLRVRVVAGGELEDGTRSTGVWIDDWGIEGR